MAIESEVKQERRARGNLLARIPDGAKKAKFSIGTGNLRKFYRDESASNKRPSIFRTLKEDGRTELDIWDVQSSSAITVNFLGTGGD